MKYLFIVVAFLMHGYLFAQYEAANWYFGENAGIHFDANTGEVSALSDGKLNTLEGSSSISDEDGNLLFYTDGSIIYNKNHSIMDNGTGLYGNSSSTQSAIVVPKPNDDTIYYVFTVGSSVNGVSSNDGFNYSIVDISENGGLGKVTLKNKNLLSYGSEKLSAVVKDCSTQSIWVITLSTASGSSGSVFNTFYAYSINDRSINTTPVKSTIVSNISDPRGALKLSPDGTKMVSANMDDGLFLYDFDTDTGAVTNQQQLTINTTTSNKSYGVEFSSNNKYLYVNSSNDYNASDSDNASNHKSSLIQYDLEAEDISGSQVTLDNRSLFRGALQLGPDGKIYRALAASYQVGLPYLGVIETPNAAGTSANYKHNAIDLNGNSSTQGLPPFIQSFFNQKIDIIHASDGVETSVLPLCSGNIYTLQAEEITNADYLWTLNGTELTNLSEPWKMEVNQEGLYKVLITPASATICELIEGEAYVTYYDIPIANPTTDLNDICDFGNDGIEQIDLTIKSEAILGNQDEANYQVKYFETLADAEANTNVVTTPTSYENLFSQQDIYARVENVNNTNCYAITTFSITLITSPELQTQDITVCDIITPYNDGISVFNLTNGIVETNAEVTYYNTNPETTSNPISIAAPTAYTNTVKNQTIYARAVNSKTGCYTDQSFILISTDAPITLQTVYYCSDTLATLDAGISTSEINNYTYQWLNNNVAISGATSNQYTLNTVGDYEVVITDKTTRCVELSTFNLEESGPATITNIAVKDLTDINTVTVSVTGLGTYEYALYKDGMPYISYQSSNYFTDVYPGHYTVKVKDVKNSCGISEKDLDILGFPKFFTPNGDGYHDTWKIDNASNTLELQSTILIFNRYGKLVKELKNTLEEWDGTMNGTPLPSDDYWFTLTLKNGTMFNSHFSLKR
ncbi:T9SS type B sorting domain-containing protein [uncultured Formosa sp.]|uniref:T9SS type B sorting domain-containing protein n=1 Tax=uncultured Formosa sp. TaxID=255435 RepID=UPI00263539C0|nr:T9SS type B sorting domain-containing protein [uncultured Formosa sp.]